MDLECPYCKKELDINHDDGRGCQEGISHQMECPHCEKAFVFETFISYYYEPKKADCLNGDEHKWEITTTAPKEFSKMRCVMCDEERELTDDERIGFGIGTKQSFFDSLKLNTR